MHTYMHTCIHAYMHAYNIHAAPWDEPNVANPTLCIDLCVSVSVSVSVFVSVSVWDQANVLNSRLYSDFIY
jgi:hypothetical protein